MFKQKNAIGGLEKTVESFETIIGASTEVHGRILIDESVRIDGSVIGNVEARQGKSITVALGKTGTVRGDIHAHRVLIAGTV
jgi:cytoskeletal protein CcmA (bactofilin family)